MPTSVRIVCSTVTFILVGAITVGTRARADKQTASRSQPLDDNKPSEYASPQIARLEMFVGPWNVTEKHYNTRGDVVATVKGTEAITWILDRRAIRRVYTTGTDSSVFRAIGVLTFNDVAKKYHGVWFDNVSTAGPTTVKGEWSVETRAMVFTLESSAKDGTAVRHKVVERFVDEEHRVATTYRMKGTDVVKRMEVQYERTTPCPARIRVIFDDPIGERGR